VLSWTPFRYMLFRMRYDHPNTSRYTIMRVLMNMSGTAGMLALLQKPPTLMCGMELYVLRIRVRTEETRLISRAFTLASSRWPPKPGSAAEAVQPTVLICQYVTQLVCLIRCV
jgi:hypothetical protein